ncbi:MAG: protein kinase, partial [Chloroflexi bacterium]|nr:protein kinase [Chloroflexota bacterium]
MKNLLVSLQQEREPQYQQTFAPGEGQKPIAPPTVHTPQARNPNQIFVSHSSQDKDLAQQVAADLKTNGYDIFITPNSIKPGEKWVPAIGRGMEESGIFLVLLTHNAVQSSWVNDETNMAIALAHENEMRVFFLDVENCRPPIMWRQRQFLPFRSKDYKQNLANLLQALGSGTPARQSVAKPRKPAVPMLEPLGEGSRLGRYEIISRLAEGKESIVYLGHNAVQKTRQLAIKVLQDQFLDNEAVVAQFLREAKMMDTVSHHANIVQMRGLEQDGKRFFFAMHYMTDGALQDRLQEGSLSLTEALPIIKRIAAALDFIHEKGIVHRELIPESILFNRKNAFLSDFSNARSPDFEETNPPETAPQYMSPEQIERADDLDHRSDIYSLGIILYEMLAGHCPFDGNNERVIHGAHLYKPVPNILASVPQLPVGVADVVRKALAKERNERYESALALYKALEAAARTSPDPAYMWQRQQKQAAQHESDGEYAQAAEIWKELNELEKAVALYETSELWDEAAQLWTQLKQLAKAALAWEQQAKTLTDSGADDQEINNVWQQAIQAHSAADNDARAAEIWQTLGEIEKAAE